LMSAYLISQDFTVGSLFFNKIMLLCTPLWLIVVILTTKLSKFSLGPLRVLISLP
jgi:hypothetical protein